MQRLTITRRLSLMQDIASQTMVDNAGIFMDIAMRLS